jgi:hypothetical protein
MRSLPLVLFCVLAVQASAQTFDLGFKPTKGSKTNYTLSFAIDGQSQKIVYRAKIRNEVVDAKEDGSYIVASYQTGHEVLVDGVSKQTAADTITTVTTYDKVGKPSAIGGDNANPVSFRVANLTSFIAPPTVMKVGETWTVRILGDKAKGTVDVNHAYKLASVEKQAGKDVAVVEFTVTEVGANGASAKGKAWIDLSNGETVRYEATMTNMPSDGGPVNGKVTLVRAG